MYARLRTVRRRVGIVLVALVLGCLVVAAVGYAIGPDPGVQSVPMVDTDERPAEVVADAATQLHVRDHTWNLRLWERNLTTGSVSGGILWQMRVQHSQNRIRITI